MGVLRTRRTDAAVLTLPLRMHLPLDLRHARWAPVRRQRHVPLRIKRKNRVNTREKMPATRGSKAAAEF